MPYIQAHLLSTSLFLLLWFPSYYYCCLTFVSTLKFIPTLSRINLTESHTFHASFAHQSNYSIEKLFYVSGAVSCSFSGSKSKFGWRERVSGKLASQGGTRLDAHDWDALPRGSLIFNRPVRPLPPILLFWLTPTFFYFLSHEQWHYRIWNICAHESLPGSRPGLGKKKKYIIIQ